MASSLTSNDSATFARAIRKHQVRRPRVAPDCPRRCRPPGRVPPAACLHRRRAGSRGFRPTAKRSVPPSYAGRRCRDQSAAADATSTCLSQARLLEARGQPVLCPQVSILIEGVNRHRPVSVIWASARPTHLHSANLDHQMSACILISSTLRRDSGNENCPAFPDAARRSDRLRDCRLRSRPPRHRWRFAQQIGQRPRALERSRNSHQFQFEGR